MLPEAYDDTPADRHALAGRSALAHLIKLRTEGRVEGKEGGPWRARESPLAEGGAGS